MTTNHNPNITSSSATGSFTEDANTTGSTVDHVLTGTMNFTDSDHSDTHTTTTALKTAVWSGGSTLPVGALTKFQAGLTSSIISDSNGAGKLKWTFSEDDRDFDFLAKGETLVLTYEITLKDNHGGSTKQTVKLTITGTDDKPVFTTAAEATISEQANKTLSFSPDTANIAVQFTDVDLNNTGHTACVLSVSATGNTAGILPGSLGTAELMSFFDITNVVKNAGSANGVINTKFSAPDLAFDYLAAGEQIQITYVVQVDDKKGGLSTQNVVVTVNGTNDKPVVLGFPESRHLTEGADLSAGNLVAHGDFLFTDVDLSDTHTISTTVTATLSGGGTVPISEADLIAAMGAALADDPNSPGNPNDSTGDLFGKVSWSFALPDSAANFLTEGQVLTLKYHIIVTDPSGASDSEEVCITIVGTNDPDLTVTATVPGGTADTVGEVISYAIAFSNSGSTPLTGVTISDPFVSDLAPVLSGGFNIGDTDHDNQLDAGETWQYTASHTVTQSDIDFGFAGISNTATADSNETDPVSASAFVVVEQRPDMEVIKTADVGTVDSAGNVITYTVTVHNNGNTTLSGLSVTDPQVNIVTPILGDPVLSTTNYVTAPKLDGDYNVGDTNQNGIEDPGETFQYRIRGDDNDNGVQDPGEEPFVFANIGDTNQNGVNDPTETFQFYNAGDTNQNGVEDSGETFQFNVSHDLTPADANNDGLNDGDVNMDGELDVGETWTYTATYTVTQADIDNGGVVDPGLTHDNTVTVQAQVTETASESVVIDQNPHVTLTKTATVPGGTGEVGEVISYTLAVTNDGNMTLTNPVVTDPSVSNLAAVMSGGFNAGDTDHDGKLDLGETWQYTANHTVTQADIDNGGVVNPALTYTNTASVTTDQGATDADANDTASASVPIVQNPHLTLDKTATVADGTADAVGDVINYAITVANDGNMTLTNPVVSDPSVSNLAAVLSGGFNAGDTDHDGKLDVGETWQYTANHTVTQADIDNGTYTNTASVTTDQGVADPDANDTDSASVSIVQNPHISMSKTATVPGGTADTAGEVISYDITVTNDGNMTLSNPTVSDPSTGGVTAVMSGSFNAGDADMDGVFDVGEVWQYAASHTVTSADLTSNGGGDGFIDNTASASTTEGATASASASVEVVPPPPVASMSLDISDLVGTHFVDSNGNSVADTGGDLIQWVFALTNTGTLAIDTILLTDLLGESATGPDSADPNGQLDPGETWVFSHNYFLTTADITWDPLESTCRHASLSIL